MTAANRHYAKQPVAPALLKHCWDDYGPNVVVLVEHDCAGGDRGFQCRHLLVHRAKIEIASTTPAA
jgi:hypothetical protein